MRGIYSIQYTLGWAPGRPLYIYVGFRGKERQSYRTKKTTAASASGSPLGNLQELYYFFLSTSAPSAAHPSYTTSALLHSLGTQKTKPILWKRNLWPKKVVLRIPRKRNTREQASPPRKLLRKNTFQKNKNQNMGWVPPANEILFWEKMLNILKLHVHQDYAAGPPQTDYDEDDDGSQERKKYSLHLFWPKAVNICFQEMTIIIEETQIAGGYAHSGL